jgi:hypothetical protein
MKIIEESHVHPSVSQQFTEEELLKLMQTHCNGSASAVQVVTICTDRIGVSQLLKRAEVRGRIYLGIRGKRQWASPIALMPGHPTNELTLVVGPHNDEQVLYTAYWGKPAPREVGDPSNSGPDQLKSVFFWEEHVLAPDPFETTVINLASDVIYVQRRSEDDKNELDPLVLQPQLGSPAWVQYQPSFAWEKKPGTPRKPILGRTVLHRRDPLVRGLPEPMAGVVYIVDRDVLTAVSAETARPDVLCVGLSYASEQYGSVCTAWHGHHHF